MTTCLLSVDIQITKGCFGGSTRSVPSSPSSRTVSMPSSLVIGFFSVAPSSSVSTLANPAAPVCPNSESTS